MAVHINGGGATTATTELALVVKTRENHNIGRKPNSGVTGGGDNYFEGTIAYVRLWHGVALDADQVAELYAARIEPTPAPTGTVAPTP